MYNKKIKNLCYKNHKSTRVFNSKFGLVLCKLELRLNVLISRAQFAKSLKKADNIISRGKIWVNNFTRHKNYLVRVDDFLWFDGFRIRERVNKDKFKKRR
jgi:ribosomal protein S4